MLSSIHAPGSIGDFRALLEALAAAPLSRLHSVTSAAGARCGTAQARSPGFPRQAQRCVEGHCARQPGCTRWRAAQCLRRLPLPAASARGARTRADRSGPQPAARRRPRRSSRHCRCKAPAAARPARSATCCASSRRTLPHRLVGGDAAGGDQRGRLAVSARERAQARNAAGPGSFQRSQAGTMRKDRRCRVRSSARCARLRAARRS